MEYAKIIDKLKQSLLEKFPVKGSDLINTLSETLGIDTRTVSGKLLGNNQFTISELFRISQVFDISLDGICWEDEKERHSMEIYYHDFSAMDEYQKVTRRVVEIYRYAMMSEHSVYMTITNTVPNVFLTKFDNIGYFAYLRWVYFNMGPGYITSISDIRFPEKIFDRLSDIRDHYRESIFNMGQSKYILNYYMTNNLKEIVLYFHSIGYLSGDEIRLLAGEYKELLCYLEKMCLNGRIPETGKPVEVYYSTITFPNDMSVLESDNINLGILSVFSHNIVVSKQPETFKIFRNWFMAQLRSSTIISLSNVPQCHSFFIKQRKDLEQLYFQLENLTDR